MNRNRVLFLLWTVVFIIVCGIIFMFSAQNGETSGKLSEGVTQKIFFGIISKETLFMLEKAVRKFAHYGIYFLLGVSAFYSVAFGRLFFGKEDTVICAKNFFCASFACFIYSVSDEFHQSFVPGRNGSFTDCLIDLCGALCGILIAALIYRFFKNKNK